jgi:hypothetical protein
MKAGLERVQRRFLKYLFHITEGHFPPRGIDHAVLLGKYFFTHLQCRRDIADARFLDSRSAGLSRTTGKKSVSCSQAEFKRQVLLFRGQGQMFWLVHQYTEF